MTRAATGDTVIVRPTNNIYTVLTGVAVLAQILGLVVLFMRAQTEFNGLL